MTETPDAHMVETLRLRTAALHRVIGSNDQLRRENDDLRARLARVEALAESAGDLDNGILAWDLNAALCGPEDHYAEQDRIERELNDALTRQPCGCYGGSHGGYTCDGCR